MTQVWNDGCIEGVWVFHPGSPHQSVNRTARDHDNEWCAIVAKDETFDPIFIKPTLKWESIEGSYSSTTEKVYNSDKYLRLMGES